MYFSAPASPRSTDGNELELIGSSRRNTTSFSPSESFGDDILEDCESIASPLPESPAESFGHGLLLNPQSFEDNTIISSEFLNSLDMTLYKKNVMSRPGKDWSILELVDIPKAVPGKGFVSACKVYLFKIFKIQ